MARACARTARQYINSEPTYCTMSSPDGELQSNDGSANGTSGSNYTVLQGIEVFMLLDLIGGTRPTFHSFDPSTDFLFMRLIDLENKLGSFQQLSDTVGHPYFQPISNSLSRPQIGDDHTPFAERNVPIAHLIQWPFPKFWHKLEDNESIIDPDATMDMMRVLAAFLAEYFHLSV
ncbi:hypothetical protein SARC_05772 [Sphaeroforma arctica JP610]|uniref:Peptidase M28 domain-containing protein n=1 Tax=Sphaeroforma arctica JP610 TaxID=667725 RepID=A0A0L0FZD2_9EUKA|nr:hypothetical protein SARC_05772 [Sphaeroforma arctica JP610]KNC81921.1 hypothetical protein SARC_05772 [Sphaeroforma arctica JP610]|eukprot:XP_014155823.1 hypothetical protein SARC_05772 [Sphaeroforma arctica JP610]